MTPDRMHALIREYAGSVGSSRGLLGQLLLVVVEHMPDDGMIEAVRRTTGGLEAALNDFAADWVQINGE